MCTWGWGHLQKAWDTWALFLKWDSCGGLLYGVCSCAKNRWCGCICVDLQHIACLWKQLSWGLWFFRCGLFRLPGSLPGSCVEDCFSTASRVDGQLHSGLTLRLLIVAHRTCMPNPCVKQCLVRLGAMRRRPPCITLNNAAASQAVPLQPPAATAHPHRPYPSPAIPYISRTPGAAFSGQSRLATIAE